MSASCSRALLLIVVLAAAPARAEPANTLREIWRTFGGCFAGVRLSTDSEVTVVFSLKRNGSLNGKPRISYAKLIADQTQRASDAQAIARALDACLPVAITDGLGGAIAGRPLALRIGGKRQTDL
jgi:hypothetical protein